MIELPRDAEGREIPLHADLHKEEFAFEDILDRIRKLKKDK